METEDLSFEPLKQELSFRPLKPLEPDFAVPVEGVNLEKEIPNKCNICSGLVSNKNFVRKFKVLIRAPFRGTFRAKYRYRDQTKVRPMCCWQVNPYQMNSCRRIEEIRLDF